MNKNTTVDHNRNPMLRDQKTKADIDDIETNTNEIVEFAYSFLMPM
jgi:hypothetical protein